MRIPTVLIQSCYFSILLIKNIKIVYHGPYFSKFNCLLNTSLIYVCIETKLTSQALAKRL